MSRFREVIKSAKNRQPESEQEQIESALTTEALQQPKSTASTEAIQQTEEAALTEVVRKPTPQAESKRGRPKGKRSNPDYEQVTAYIRRATYRDVKIALLQKGDSREFSELVEDLLSEWLKS